MPIPRFDDIAHIALVSDDVLLERVRSLVIHAHRRQLWLMFLDARHRQLPVLVPHDVPSAPNHAHRTGFRRFVRGLVDDIRPGSIVVALERPGVDVVRHGDRAWFALVDDACRAARVTMRGPILVHDRGCRWIAAEDLVR